MKFSYFAICLILFSGTSVFAQNIRYAESRHDAPRLPFEASQDANQDRHDNARARSLPAFADSRIRVASRLPKRPQTSSTPSAKEILTPIKQTPAALGSGIIQRGASGVSHPASFQSQTRRTVLQNADNDHPDAVATSQHSDDGFAAGYAPAIQLGLSGNVWRNPYFPNSGYFNGQIDPNRPGDFYRVEISNWASENGWGEGAGPPQGPALSFNYFDCGDCDDWRCFCSGMKDLRFDCTCRGPKPCPGDCPGNPTSVIDKINCRTCIGTCTCRHKRGLRSRVSCEDCGSTSCDTCNSATYETRSRGILGDAAHRR